MQEPIRNSNGIVPFWRRMPKFFFSPANPKTLLRIVLLSIMCAAPLTLMQSQMFILLLGGCNFIAWVIFFRYAYHVMYMTSQGYLTPEDYPHYIKQEHNYKPYKQMLVFILIAVMIGLVFGLLGKVLGFIYMFLAILALPTCIMVIALDDSVGDALNPLKSLRIMSTIGWPYLVMFGFLFVLYSSQGLASQWLVKTQLPVFKPSFSPEEKLLFQAVLAKKLQWIAVSTTLVSMYFTIIMFNMIGYVLYQYHEDLGLSVRIKPSQGSSEALIAGHIAGGDIDSALKIAQDELGKDPASIQANDRYLKLLLMSDAPVRAGSHAQRFISLLLKQRKTGKALEVYENMLNADGDFRPAEAGEVLPIARAAGEAKKPELALRIMKQFDKRFPHSRDTPYVYLYGAKVICEGLNNYAEARKILRAILHKYPEHPIIEETGNYLRLVEQLEKT